MKKQPKVNYNNWLGSYCNKIHTKNEQKIDQKREREREMKIKNKTIGNISFMNATFSDDHWDKLA